jgi:hypothetical protein
MRHLRKEKTAHEGIKIPVLPVPCGAGISSYEMTGNGKQTQEGA